MAAPGVIVGRTLGHYCIFEEIGVGGMGVVYRARDEHLERDVALKILPPGTLAGESARKRFRAEALALSKVNHPNIATVHDFDTQNNVDFLVMEYIPGATLCDKLASGALPEADVRALGAQLADGLSAAHEQGVVHRDIKPGNLRLTSDGRLKILDFGLAHFQAPGNVATTKLIDTQVIGGTLPYMAPEQLLGGEIDARTDIHAAGLVLYEMATGRQPFAEVERAKLIGAILRDPPSPASAMNRAISPGLERVIGKCLQKDPARRYQSAHELAVELRRNRLASSTTIEELRATRARNGRGETADPDDESKTVCMRKNLCACARRNAGSLLLAFTVLLIVAGLLFRSRAVHALTSSDTIVLADFVNSTPDAVFDDALNQALTIELEQSPYLKILPQAKVQETLALMGRSPQQPLTSEIARDLCQRTAAKAFLRGSINPLGTHYVIGLTAVECSSGNRLAIAQVQSANKEEVLKALGKAATQVRSTLGESVGSLRKFDAPLEVATTPSLEALKAYSSGRKIEYQKGTSAAIPLFKRAIELDPNFAVAYSALGIAYSNLGEPGLANENMQRAYDLRDRVSEREKLRISAYYFSYVEGDLVKGKETYELWAQAYPRDGVPPGNLGVVHFYLGEYPQAVEQTLTHLRIDPDDALGYGNLVVEYAALNKLDEAKAAYEQASQRKLEELSLHANRYGVAFLEEEKGEMQRQIAWATGQAGAEDVLLSLASDTEAFYGRLANARAASQRAVASAKVNGQKETAAGWQMNAALREAEFGNAAQARQATSYALDLASTRDAQILAGLALARAGASAEAQRIAVQLASRFPHDTLVNGYWLPTINAAIEMNRGNPSKAIEILQVAAPYELAEPYPMFEVGGSLYPVYLRAQAYLMLYRGSQAAAEFQKILDHRGIVMNCPLGALARLGLARAYALQGDYQQSRTMYDEFLTLWKDADPSIPVLIQAKAEMAQLDRHAISQPSAN